jgi:hypothetical protein
MKMTKLELIEMIKGILKVNEEESSTSSTSLTSIGSGVSSGTVDSSYVYRAVLKEIESRKFSCFDGNK